jgi:hypothetical protein
VGGSPPSSSPWEALWLLYPSALLAHMEASQRRAVWSRVSVHCSLLGLVPGGCSHVEQHMAGWGPDACWVLVFLVYIHVIHHRRIWVSLSLRFM